MRHPINKRIELLTAEEQDELFGVPRFADHERTHYFALDKTEQSILNRISTLKHKLHFVLLLGYFKAKPVFVCFEWGQVTEDVNHILQRYFPGRSKPRGRVSADVRSTQQTRILRLLGYHKMTPALTTELKQSLSQPAQQTLDAQHLFRQALEFMAQKRVALPGYSTFQKIISAVITEEEKKRLVLFEQHCPLDLLTELDTLMASVNEMSEISSIKGQPRQFYQKDLQRELNKLKRLKPLYAPIEILVSALNLTPQQVRYFSDVSARQVPAEFRRHRSRLKYLYLACFIRVRFQRLLDYLIKAFLEHVCQLEQKAWQYARDQLSELTPQTPPDLDRVVQLLKLFTDENVDDAQPFSVIRQQAFAILSAQAIETLSAFLQQKIPEKRALFWQYQDDHEHGGLKKLLRGILTELEFKFYPAQAALEIQVNLLKSAFQSESMDWSLIMEKGDATLIPPTHRSFISEPDLRPKRFEYWIWRQLSDLIEQGKVSVPQSLGHKSLEEDLIQLHDWRQRKQSLIEHLGLSRLEHPVEQLLDTLKRQLDERFKRVNERIAQHQNPFVQIKNDGETLRWSVAAPADEPFQESELFEQLPRISVVNLLNLVARETGCLKSFAPLQPRYVKTKIEPTYQLACLLALGTHLGLKRMADSSDLDYESLRRTYRNYFSQESLIRACDQVIHCTRQLPIYRAFQIAEDTVYASSDGQRFASQYETPRTQYCRKYFGSGPGVVVYTLVGDQLALRSRIIEKDGESNYVLDLLLQNDSDVQPDILSTDTHGVNNLNFALLYFFGFQFAPRYAQLSTRVAHLYGFDKPGRHKDNLIRPSHQVDRQRLVEEWDNIQRILVSLALGHTSQYRLVKKLNRSKTGNRTLQALWDFNHLMRTLYILEYLDDAPLRHCVQKTLNRGEQYHHLRRALAELHGGKFRARSDLEMELHNQCSVLLANCVIYYNAALLSRLLEQAHGDVARQKIASASPVGWQHIALTGRYDFSEASHLTLSDWIGQMDFSTLKL